MNIYNFFIFSNCKNAYTLVSNPLLSLIITSNSYPCKPVLVATDVPSAKCVRFLRCYCAHEELALFHDAEVESSSRKFRVLFDGSFGRKSVRINSSLAKRALLLQKCFRIALPCWFRCLPRTSVKKKISPSICAPANIFYSLMQTYLFAVIATSMLEISRSWSSHRLVNRQSIPYRIAFSSKLLTPFQ